MMRSSLVAMGVLVSLAAGASGACAAAPRASLPAIERQVMCVTCKIPLNVAQSPQAERERALIRDLIARGLSEAQIKRALVAQYGRSVLALPSAGGFGLLAYLVPLAVVIGALAALAVLLPRWRARSRADTQDRVAPAPLSQADATRLDADMARFD